MGYGRPQGGIGCLGLFRNLFSNLFWMSTGGTLLLAVILLFGVWRSGGQFFRNLSAMINQPQPSPKVDVRSVVVEQVRGASELTTAVFTMEAVVPTSSDKILAGFVVGTTKLLYIARGEVKAGVDLSQLTPEQVELVNDTIKLRLPAPQILDRKIDVEHSSVYDYNRGWLGPDVAPQLQQLAQQEALRKLTIAACQGNVLGEANDRAKLVVTQLLTMTGYKEVIVETQLPDANACTLPTTTAKQPTDPTAADPNAIAPSPQIPNAGQTPSVSSPNPTLIPESTQPSTSLEPSPSPVAPVP